MEGKKKNCAQTDLYSASAEETLHETRKVQLVRKIKSLQNSLSLAYSLPRIAHDTRFQCYLRRRHLSIFFRYAMEMDERPFICETSNFPDYQWKKYNDK